MYDKQKSSQFLNDTNLFSAISPHFVVSEDKRTYSFKDFVINKDYRISIYTEEKEAGERPQSGGDNYRIDNFGEFYEANW